MVGPYPPELVALIIIFTAMFGAVVGSFLNVCIHRLPRTYLSIAWPGSHCPQCGTFLHWYDNIPIFSWITLGGACRYCKGRISGRYVFVEALTSVLFVLAAYWIILTPVKSFHAFLGWERWFALVVAWYLIANMIIITFIDMAYRIIPDSLNYTGIMLAPFVSVICPLFHPEIPVIENPHLAGLLSSILGIIVGGGILYVVGVIGKIIFRKEAMGLGDVKMMAMVGGFLGWKNAILIFLFACIIGTVFGIISLIITKDRYTPFGPHLAIGTLAVLMWHDELLHFALVVWPKYIYQVLGLPIPMWD